MGTNLLPYLGICREGGVDGESSKHLALVSRGPGCYIVWMADRKMGMSFSDGSALRLKYRESEDMERQTE